MHGLTIASIILLIFGIITFLSGTYLLWKTSPPYSVASLLITTGLLFMLGSIVALCISLQYNNKPEIITNS